ncbi:L,D-transpeptidase family protein [Caulobacter sp.]|uniref:L,D-transpeptidase family protein n=1 Tax=Caulobacter sp. TaxID=78 RepID=UPI001B12D3D5|nr:L,D-transpeptidase family protein [Caulobacter sp.]MBO9546019.1 L,D-transpeptidase family protein [Caulobacter sp.]
MLFRAHADGRFELDGRVLRCAIGKAGVIAGADKREGDNRSPLGTWVMREVWYRPDVYPEGPKTALPVRATRREDGWCDAPGDPNYNRPITLPYPASAERMWRDDHVYDLVVILGHNDDPPVPGMGSAIFMHLAREGYPGTEGCVALERADIEAVLAAAKPGDAVEIVAE